MCAGVDAVTAGDDDDDGDEDAAALGNCRAAEGAFDCAGGQR